MSQMGSGYKKTQKQNIGCSCRLQLVAFKSVEMEAAHWQLSAE